MYFDILFISDFVQQVTSHKKLSVFATPGRHTFLIPINRGFEVIDLLSIFLCCCCYWFLAIAIPVASHHHQCTVINSRANAAVIDQTTGGCTVSCKKIRTRFLFF